MSYLSGQATSSQNISFVINKIQANFQLSNISIVDARKELIPIIGAQLANAAAIRLAYRGKAGSLICVLAIGTHDFEILSCCKKDISIAVSDFNWFWHQLAKIQKLTMTDVRADVKPSTFFQTVKDPYFSGLLTTVVWALISGITKNMAVASVVAIGVLLSYGLVLYLLR
jgi:hypothetical protein